MDVLCGYTMRSACHVSHLSPSSASTSKYSSTALGHRAPHRHRCYGARRQRQPSWSQLTQTSHTVSAAVDTASSQQRNLDSLQLTTTQPPSHHTPQRATLTNSRRLARSTVHGFAAAALLTLIFPDPSYSAESLPIEFLRTWVVSSVPPYRSAWGHSVA